MQRQILRQPYTDHVLLHYLIKTLKKKSESTFLSNALAISEKSCLFFWGGGGSSQALPLCPGESSMWVKMSMEYRWNATGENRSTRDGNPVLVSICALQISHGLNTNRSRVSVVTDRRLTALAMAWPRILNYNYIIYKD